MHTHYRLKFDLVFCIGGDEGCWWSHCMKETSSWPLGSYFVRKQTELCVLFAFFLKMYATLPFDFLVSDISSWKHTNHPLCHFSIWLIRLSKINTHIIFRPPAPLYVWFYLDTRDPIFFFFLLAYFWLTEQRKKKSIWKKINVSRFPPAWTATRWNLSRRGKDLTFCTGVNSAFVCQPTCFSLYNILLSVSSACLMSSFIWRLSIVQIRNILT